MSSRGDDNQAEPRKVNYFTSTQSFIDSNIRAVQNGIYILGGVGLVIAARGLYLYKVFTRVEDIPSSFILKQVRLRGRVRKISDEDILSIEHIPVFEFRIPFTKQRECNAFLPVHLACIDPSPDGRLWMKENILHQIVWFHLLHRTTPEIGNQSHLYSRIELPRKFRRNLYVNEELVKQGLAKISSLSTIEDVCGVQTNPYLLSYLDKLIKLEDLASKKGRGMWVQPLDDSWSKKGLNTIKYIIYCPYRFVKWIYTKRKKTR